MQRGEKLEGELGEGVIVGGQLVCISGGSSGVWSVECEKRDVGEFVAMQASWRRKE